MTSTVTQFADKSARYKIQFKKHQQLLTIKALDGVEIVFLVAHLVVVSFDFVNVPF